MNLLLILNGEYDSRIEVPNDFKNKKWERAGEYNSYGIFCIRRGEHEPLLDHFAYFRKNKEEYIQ